MIRSYFAAGGRPTIELIAGPVASPEVVKASRKRPKAAGKAMKVGSGEE